jgi:tetratricopeptide (TPR) repeat protein
MIPLYIIQGSFIKNKPDPMKMVRFLIVILLNLTFLWCQPDYYTSNNIYRFAEYLYQNGDFQAAAGEFQRYVFSAGYTVNTDSVLLKIGDCYQKGKSPDVAIGYYENVLKNRPSSFLYDRVHFEIAKTYTRNGDFETSLNHIQNFLPAISSDSVKYHMHKLSGINYLYQQKWKNAREKFSTLKASEPHDSNITKLCQLAEAGENLNYKSPFIAGLFSSIIPGSGKVYAGRWEDGLFSFVSIGFYTWQSWDGFNRDGKDSTKGWIYGIVGSVFYLGNIYGSVIAARVMNERRKEEFIPKLELAIEW